MAKRCKEIVLFKVFQTTVSSSTSAAFLDYSTFYMCIYIYYILRWCIYLYTYVLYRNTIIIIIHIVNALISLHVLRFAFFYRERYDKRQDLSTFFNTQVLQGLGETILWPQESWPQGFTGCPNILKRDYNRFLLFCMLGKDKL